MRRTSLAHFLRHLSTGRALLLITGIGFIAAVLWLTVGPRVAESVGLNDDQWKTLGSFTSAVAFAFAFGTGIIALVEFGQAVDSRNLDIYRDIYQKLMSEEQIEARRTIYNLPEYTDRQARIKAIYADDDAKKAIKDVLNLFDYFGFIVAQDWVTADEIIGWLSPVVVKVWERIEPAVTHEREQRPEEPDYYISAVELASRCQAWRGRHYRDLPKITFDSRRL